MGQLGNLAREPLEAHEQAGRYRIVVVAVAGLLLRGDVKAEGFALKHYLEDGADGGGVFDGS